MIPIAHPLASEKVSKLILESTDRLHSKGTLLHGIKACQKTILTGTGTGTGTGKETEGTGTGKEGTGKEAGKEASSKETGKGKEAGKEYLLVLSAATSPMDLITHLPVVCENRKVPYIFVENNQWMKGFNCVLLPVDEIDSEILKESS